MALATLLLAPALALGQRGSEPKALHSDDGSFLGAVDSVHLSILTVVAYPPVDAAHPSKRKRLIGTAVALSNRQILTTASMAIPGGNVRVLLGGGVERPAVLLGVDRTSNVALLQVEGATLRALQPAPPQSLAIGSWVAVISNIAITKPQAALGRVVGRGERMDYPHSGEILEIDAPSYPGSTGGAVLNEEGDWVAVIVGRAVPGNLDEGSRVGLERGGEAMPDPNSVLIGLPVEQVEWLAKELQTYGSVRHGFLGVQLRRGADPSATDSLGVLVASVVVDSPADSAGLRTGDRILAIQGQEAHTADELTGFVRSSRPGDVVELTVLRQSEIFPMRVTIGAAFSQPPVGPRPSTSTDVTRMKQELERLDAQRKQLEDQIKALQTTPGR
ncbi:MAG: S1C family serine protease [Candidatus Eiseniibacteriota bacterium]